MKYLFVVVGVSLIVTGCSDKQDKINHDVFLENKEYISNVFGEIITERELNTCAKTYNINTGKCEIWDDLHSKYYKNKSPSKDGFLNENDGGAVGEAW